MEYSRFGFICVWAVGKEMRTIYWTLMLGVATILTTMVVAKPGWLSDENAFLADFINHEILNVYGIFVAITLASASQLHLSLNNIEERKVYFQKTRLSIKHSCMWMAGFFCIAVIVMTIKGSTQDNVLIGTVVNAVSLWILLANIIAMWDITSTVFRIGPDIKPKQFNTGQ